MNANLVDGLPDAKFVIFVFEIVSRGPNLFEKENYCWNHGRLRSTIKAMLEPIV